MENEQNFGTEVFVSDAMKDYFETVVGNSKARIPFTKIKIQLDKDTPTVLDPAEFGKQLHKMGLKCEETTPERIKEHVKNVVSGLHIGRLQSFGMFRGSVGEKYVGSNNDTEYAKASWKPHGVSGYQKELGTVIKNENYDYLKKEAKDFPYSEVPSVHKAGRAVTTKDVQELFNQALSVCIASTVVGMDEEDLKALSSQIVIGEVSTGGKFTIDTTNVIIYIVDNYKESDEESDGVGVIRLSYSLTVDGTNDKKEDANKQYTLDVSARCVMYSSIELLEKHFDKVSEEE